jgi:[ribosomal protein S5]-alanine N-acetyltransferase
MPMRVRRPRGTAARASGLPAPDVVAGHVSERVQLRYLTDRDETEFLELVHESRTLHRPWAYPPERPDQFQDLLAKCRRDDSVCLLATDRATGEIAGVFTVSQIVRGAFQSAFLGYYAGVRHAGQGYMREAIDLVVDLSFGPLALHRLEANIQPGNAASIALAKGAGFRLEGFSPRYLLIGGQWRDHERYALTADERRARRRAG